MVPACLCMVNSELACLHRLCQTSAFDNQEDSLIAGLDAGAPSLALPAPRSSLRVPNAAQRLPGALPGRLHWSTGCPVSERSRASLHDACASERCRRSAGRCLSQPPAGTLSVANPAVPAHPWLHACQGELQLLARLLCNPVQILPPDMPCHGRGGQKRAPRQTIRKITLLYVASTNTVTLSYRTRSLALLRLWRLLMWCAEGLKRAVRVIPQLPVKLWDQQMVWPCRARKALGQKEETSIPQHCRRFGDGWTAISSPAHMTGNTWHSSSS